MTKKITSFSLEQSTLQLLKLLAEKEERSQAKILDILIREAAGKAKIKLPKL